MSNEYKTICFYEDKAYEPLNQPQGDTEELSMKGDRLMFRHARNSGSELFTAPTGILTSGWVLGVFL